MTIKFVYIATSHKYMQLQKVNSNFQEVHMCNILKVLWLIVYAVHHTLTSTHLVSCSKYNGGCTSHQSGAVPMFVFTTYIQKVIVHIICTYVC